MEEIMKLLEEHPELKEAYDKLVQFKGELSLDDVKEFLQEHNVSLDGVKELADDVLDNVAGGFNMKSYVSKAKDVFSKAQGVISAQEQAGKLGELAKSFLNRDDNQ